MPQSAQVELQPALVDPIGRDDDVIVLGPDDFQRIGVQPSETRLAVIRRAASRAAKSLASRQLAAPNSLTEQQLSQVAVSTYRLLDPRQRDDRQSRAHVGRIRPGDLHLAGRTEFADGNLLRRKKRPMASGPVAPPVEEAVTTPADTVKPNVHEASEAAPDRLLTGLDAASIVSDGTGFSLDSGDQSFVGKLRRKVQQPAWIITIMLALLLAAIALLFWGRSISSLPDRINAAATQSASSR